MTTEPNVTTFPPPGQTKTIAEQLAVFERAGAELRKRFEAERRRMEVDFERRLAEYEATVRATIIDMKAAHELELQTLERLVKRFETL